MEEVGGDARTTLAVVEEADVERKERFLGLAAGQVHCLVVSFLHIPSWIARWLVQDVVDGIRMLMAFLEGVEVER